MSEELLNFHEVVSHIERLEEEVCDDHAALCSVSTPVLYLECVFYCAWSYGGVMLSLYQNMNKWTNEHLRLQKDTMQVPYDVEGRLIY